MLTLELAPADCPAPGGEPTLDEMIVSAWEGLTARRVVPCPVCTANMGPDYGVASQVLRGRCTACGCTLN